MAAPLQLSLFDDLDLAEITSPDYRRRAADRLPQSLAGGGAPAQARGLAGRDRARPEPHRAGDRAQARAAARPRSASGSAPRSIGTRWQSTTSRRSPTPASSGA